jgi:hypothetical protein
VKFPTNLSQSGAILIIVLWAILLLTTIAALAINMSLILQKDESVYTNNSQIIHAIDDGIKLAIVDLIRKKIVLSKWREENTYVIFDKNIRISISNEDGKINIHRAPIQVIEIFMRAQQVKVPDSEKKSSSFDFTLDILNSTPNEKYDHNLLQDLTVFSPLVLPQKEIASPRVIKVIDEYSRTLSEATEEAPRVLEVTAKTLRIEGCYQQNSNQQLCRLAIVRITGNPHSPYQVFVWIAV